MAAIFFDIAWVRFTLLLLGLTVGTLAVTGVGFYFLIRVLAGALNKRLEAWETSATSLGFEVNREQRSTYKPLVGRRGGYDVKVEYFAVPRGKNSFDDYASVDVAFDKPLNVSLDINSREGLYQKFAEFFDDNDINVGHEAFDEAFTVHCADQKTILTLLHLDMPGGKSPALFTDLIAARKKYLRVKVSDASVCLSVRADLGRSDLIDPTIDSAIYLVERFNQAVERLAAKQSNL